MGGPPAVGVNPRAGRIGWRRSHFRSITKDLSFGEPKKYPLGPSDETKNSFFPIIYFNSFFRHNALCHHPSRIVRMIIHLVFDHNIWPHLSYPPPPPPPGFYELYKSTIGADEGPGRGTIIRGGAGEKGN
jgi:hypothetical protein